MSTQHPIDPISAALDNVRRQAERYAVDATHSFHNLQWAIDELRHAAQDSQGIPRSLATDQDHYRALGERYLSLANDMTVSVENERLRASGMSEKHPPISDTPQRGAGDGGQPTQNQVSPDAIDWLEYIAEEGDRQWDYIANASNGEEREWASEILRCLRIHNV